MIFEDYFQRCTDFQSHGWQTRLAGEKTCRDRLIRIPTGFGKTAGVTIAWLWNRVEKRNDAWPRRLVLCLPMRTLVEQTNHAVSKWVERAGLKPRKQVHVLMGGLTHSDWHLNPEKETVLIGTQDMLLSRALNRGYGSGRARWPMEYALLNVDCLWVLDEIQLMGVGLATSAQLQAFANQDTRTDRLPRPRRTWWMSATLQRDWLSRAPDLDGIDALPFDELLQNEKDGPLWSVQKSVRLERIPAADDEKTEQWAKIVVETHGRTPKGVTLVIANTVKSATALRKTLQKFSTNVDLVHSRFRGAERRKWVAEFLAREHCVSGANRIVVATQVIEAGVDISAHALVTELAPWASLVQRFGRCARYGGTGEIVIVDRRHTDESALKIAIDDQERSKKRRESDEKTAQPYPLGEIEAAADAVAGLSDARPAALEDLELQRRDLLPRLYPYAPLHVPVRRELMDLFDTGPDLTGADIDVSRFVREGEERDVIVWWWPIPEGEWPHRRLRPQHDALCRVPIADARKWLVGSSDNTGDDTALLKKSNEVATKKSFPRAWVWSYLDSAWERLEARHVYPGQTILVDAADGGYDINVGFTGKSGLVPVEAEQARGIDAVDAADMADEQDDLSEGVGDSQWQYKTIATHGFEVAVQAREIARSLDLDNATVSILEISGIAHDIGKVHPAFACAIKDRNGIASDVPLAKAPKGRWHGIRSQRSRYGNPQPGMYDHSPLGRRPSFRHELASALALLDLLWRAHPDHPAVQGECGEILERTIGREVPNETERIGDPQGFLARLISLDERAFNLMAYLVMSHHGKLRATLPMTPHDQENPGPAGDLPIRGVRDGDSLPGLALVDIDGADCNFPAATLRLDPARVGLSARFGPSWVERVLSLRRHYGDFQLAWMEALLRVADVRASQIASPHDPRLPQQLVEVARVPEVDRNADLERWIEKSLAAVQNGRVIRDSSRNEQIDRKSVQSAGRARRRKSQSETRRD